ncbi:MAG: hypothetical protein M0T85_01740 [Dehalococcoidales bacterium]|nr:hypothetical protein [Dehalococcoidales bacterium]
MKRAIKRFNKAIILNGLAAGFVALSLTWLALDPLVTAATTATIGSILLCLQKVWQVRWISRERRDVTEVD